MAGTAESWGAHNFGAPEFCSLDSNDEFTSNCGVKMCEEEHNILKNKYMQLPSQQRMNWWDFLDVLVCLEKSAQCKVCTKCNWCKYYFRNLLGEAWGLTWNSWWTKRGQVFVAVLYSSHDERYARHSMTVKPVNRRAVSPLELAMFEQKEKNTLERLRKKFHKYEKKCLF